MCILRKGCVAVSNLGVEGHTKAMGLIMIETSQKAVVARMVSGI